MEIQENKFDYLKTFSSIGLDAMQQVKFMSRLDTKYYFHKHVLRELLESIKPYYYILSINNDLILPYQTIYYDTLEDKMFTAHHNGKLNRYKIRRRSYVNSKLSFLEVKFKTNKGRTIKERISTSFNNMQFNAEEAVFLSSHTPFKIDELRPSLINNFSRITLINKNFSERCTIDLHLNFKGNNAPVELDELVIVEIKSEGNAPLSPLSKALRDKRIKVTGFSKYCVGRSYTDFSVKTNAFKAKLRNIQKLIHTSTNLIKY